MRDVIAEEGLPADVTAGPVAELLCKVDKERATSAAPILSPGI
jgi:hypothetical protein